jgi:hypothetical protein
MSRSPLPHPATRLSPRLPPSFRFWFLEKNYLPLPPALPPQVSAGEVQQRLSRVLGRGVLPPGRANGLANMLESARKRAALAAAAAAGRRLDVFPSLLITADALTPQVRAREGGSSGERAGSGGRGAGAPGGGEGRRSSACGSCRGAVLRNGGWSWVVL